jgi:ABC-type methionine transport system permease subunit
METIDVLQQLAVISITVFALWFYHQLIHGDTKSEKRITIYTSSSVASRPVRIGERVYLRENVPLLMMKDGSKPSVANFVAASGIVSKIGCGSALVAFDEPHPFKQNTMWIQSYDLSLEPMSMPTAVTAA